MITQEVDNIDIEEYCYETNLDFGKEYGQRLLDAIITDNSFLIQRKQYLDPRVDMKEVFHKLTSIADGRLLKKRGEQVHAAYQGLVHIDFKQYSLSDIWVDELVKLMPSWLTEISSIPIIQISQGGDFLAPHKDHKRTASLFMILQGNKEQTRWYRETDEFPLLDFWRVPDLDKIELVASANIEEFKWTVFNHDAWHSVHGVPGQPRITIGIDFDSISAKELAELVKQHE